MFPIVLTLALLASAESGQVSPPAPPAGDVKMIPATRPVWVGIPTASAFKRYYPKEAQKQRISGKAVLDCKVRDDGTLTACVVSEEAPRNMGFGEAALQLSEGFQMKSQTADGRPVGGGSVHLPIVFRVP